MPCNKLLFVFRKANKGNFSIEKVYETIYDALAKDPKSTLVQEKLTLSYNYDFKQFISTFLSSLFSEKFCAHITGGCNYMILAFPFKTRILTIHDFYHYQRMKGIKGWLYDTFYFKLPIKFSHHIAVVSEKTKVEVLELFKGVEQKVHVLENPLLIPKNKRVLRKRQFDKEIILKILQIGDKPLKNYERLIEATKDLNVFYNFIHVKDKIITGLIDKYNISDKAKVHSEISDDQLYALYNENDVLFFASEAEGFGLPIIEAQAFGMPVITSNIPPMNQVGQGAIFVDPFSTSSIAEGFAVLYDANRRRDDAETALMNVQKYEADKVASRYLKFYTDIA